MSGWRTDTAKWSGLVLMAKQTIDRPEVVTDEHLDFLDELRDSGITNMYGAGPYLLDEFPELNKDEGSQVLRYWMKSFEDRHPQ